MMRLGVYGVGAEDAFGRLWISDATNPSCATKLPRASMLVVVRIQGAKEQGVGRTRAKSDEKFNFDEGRFDK